MQTHPHRRLLVLTAITLVIGLLASPPRLLAQASPPSNDEMQQLLAQVQADKRAVVLKAMQLDDDEVRAFTPLYDAYLVERKKLVQRAVDLLDAYASNYQSMTDDAAGKLLKRWFELQEDDLELVEEYAKKLQRVLPATKALRFVQVENKLNTLLRMSAERNIPLAR